MHPLRAGKRTADNGNGWGQSVRVKSDDGESCQAVCVCFAGASLRSGQGGFARSKSVV